MKLKMNEIEARFAAVKSIEDPVDWSINANFAGHPVAVAARKAAGELLISDPGACGHIMRGMCLAIADHFPSELLGIGMAITLRSVRNAFAERRRELIAAGDRILAPYGTHPDGTPREPRELD